MSGFQKEASCAAWKGKKMAPKQSFEKAMEQLEKIVKELEDGDLPLEKAMKRFEQGNKADPFLLKKT